MSKKKKIFIAISIIIAALAVLYIAMSMYFKSHFYIGTTINGIDVGMKSAEEAEELLINDAERDYIFVMNTVDGKEYSLAGKAIGYKAAFPKVSEFISTQSGWDWITRIGEEDDYETERISEADTAVTLEAVKAVKELDDDSTEAPVDAAIEYSDEKGYFVKEGRIGTRIDHERTAEAVTSAIAANTNMLDLEEADCYVKPEITSESGEIRDFMKKIEVYTDVTITYEMDDGTEECIDAEISNPWIEIDDEGEAFINEKKVAEYVERFAEKHDDFGKDVQFTTTKGEKIVVPGKTYGHKVNQKSEVKEIIDDLKAGENVKREPIYTYDSMPGDYNNIGGTYFEISIADQHAWYYRDGELFADTDIVTGCVNQRHSTPKGAYQVVNKMTNVVLRGPDYASPVTYWIGCVGRPIGMHDASWRSKFGGNIYINNGSHGCVNMPYKSISTFYKLVELGTPVMVY